MREMDVMGALNRQLETAMKKKLPTLEIIVVLRERRVLESTPWIDRTASFIWTDWYCFREGWSEVEGYVVGEVETVD